jgi:hypothetical protein
MLLVVSDHCIRVLTVVQGQFYHCQLTATWFSLFEKVRCDPGSTCSHIPSSYIKIVPHHLEFEFLTENM